MLDVDDQILYWVSRSGKIQKTSTNGDGTIVDVALEKNATDMLHGLPDGNYNNSVTLGLSVVFHDLQIKVRLFQVFF